MNKYVMSFEEIDKTNLMAVGGKGANLGELSRIEGIKVPDGFCITTEAYKKIVEQNAELNQLIEQLSLLKMSDKEKISEKSKQIRRVLEETKLNEEIAEEVKKYIKSTGETDAYAIRSSATAEDLPTASFAGQQDTYLNISGIENILKHVSMCFASLYTDRAVTYRMQNGFDHHKVHLSVVVQKMIFPQASGIMFTADPVSSNRKVLSIDASFGLGEALVSGLVNADIYKVREGKILDKKISQKKLAIYASNEGGTEEKAIPSELQQVQTLTDEQILFLEKIGRKIEGYFGCPQDIEWCIAEDTFYFVQSRPITTLFPIPQNDGKNRVYISIGHLQMMTEDIKPLGMSFCHFLSFWFSGGKDAEIAGGRLFMDGTYDLASPVGRKILLSSLGKADFLMESAVLNLMKRKEFMKSMPRGKGSINAGSGALSWVSEAIKVYRKNDISIAEKQIQYNEELIQEMQKKIQSLSGEALFDYIKQDAKGLKETLTGPGNMSLMVVGGFVTAWINKSAEKWLGDKNAAEALSKSVPNNVTSEMGLALLDVADVVRKYPEAITYFDHAEDENFFERLSGVSGGDTVGIAIQEYLEKYGMRCSGEIDITKPRWSEKPTTLIPMILSNIKNFRPHSSNSIFDQGKQEAVQYEQDILQRLEQLPGGKRKAKKMKKMIGILRNVIGFREYPKYSFIKRFQIYKNALLEEAKNLVKKGLIKEKEDVFYLYFDEFREAVRTNQLDYNMIIDRKQAYEVYEKLTPPRVMTSEGEIISGEYHIDNIPQGALVGVPVSSGVIEGRARVVLRMEDANIEEGDILVAAFTDPSWTPLFVSVKGLVTEIGGLMTHGAVITREYGLPAVVGVENATKLIKDGQRIRVNGTKGYIEILE